MKHPRLAVPLLAAGLVFGGVAACGESEGEGVGVTEQEEGGEEEEEED